MLSRSASTARVARALLHRTRRGIILQPQSSSTVAASPSTRQAEPSPKRGAIAPSALQTPPIAPDVADDGNAAAAVSTSEETAATVNTTSLDEHFMRLALGQARQAASRGEVPVGALLVSRDGCTVLAMAGNGVEAACDATAHAELLCLQRAAAEAAAEASSSTQRGGGGRRGGSSSTSPSSSPPLSPCATTLWPRSATAGSTLYVTLEPCAMCAGAALLTRVGRIVYGARSAGAGADGSWVSLLPREVGSEEEEDAFSCSPSPSSSLSPPYPTLEPLPARPHKSHPALEVTRGVLAQECGGLLKDFFRRRRAEGTRGSAGDSGDSGDSGNSGDSGDSGGSDSGGERGR